MFCFLVDMSMPMTGFQQSRPAVNLPPRKVAKALRGRSTAHSFFTPRGSIRGRAKGLKPILPRLPIAATQGSSWDSPPESSVQNTKKEKDVLPEKKARSILLTAGDTYSPDSGELLPNPSNLIPLEPRFDAPPEDDQSKDVDETEDNNKSQIGDMLPGIEGSHTEGSSISPTGCQDNINLFHVLLRNLSLTTTCHS